MSQPIWEPRTVEAQPLRRWLKYSLWFAVRMPVVIACYVLFHISSLTVFCWLAQGLSGRAATIVRSGLVALEGLSFPALILVVIAATRSVDRQQSFMMALKGLPLSLAEQASVLRISLVCAAGYTIIALLPELMIGHTRPLSLSDTSQTVLTAWGITLVGTTLAPMFLLATSGPHGFFMAHRATELACARNGFHGLHLVLGSAVAFSLLLAPVHTIDYFIALPLMAPVAQFVITLFIYIGVRDVFEHESGHRETKTEAEPLVANSVK